MSAHTDFERIAADLRGAMADGAQRPWTDEAFERRALEAFRFQFEHNAVYRAFCERRERTPDSVRAWSEVPAVPARAFKVLDLMSGPADAAEVVFRTSGTTGSGARGRHPVRSLALYRASLLPSFRTHVLRGIERVRFVSLVPSAAALPDSSLSYMVGAAADACAETVAWVVDRDGRIDGAAYRDAVDRAAREGVPVLLLGTAFAFVHALEASLLAPLPPGSRVMETGGFKGRVREMPKPELYARLGEAVRLPRERIVNEYGMTELLSQLYEPVLTEGEAGAGVHVPPPWLRVRALDPTTLGPVGEGHDGLLAFMDLANLGSVCHVLTEDVGSLSGGRVRLVGRRVGAEPRGCSRAMDELMEAGAAR